MMDINPNLTSKENLWSLVCNNSKDLSRYGLGDPTLTTGSTNTQVTITRDSESLVVNYNRVHIGDIIRNSKLDKMTTEINSADDIKDYILNSINQFTPSDFKVESFMVNNHHLHLVADDYCIYGYTTIYIPRALLFRDEYPDVLDGYPIYDGFYRLLSTRDEEELIDVGLPTELELSPRESPVDPPITEGLEPSYYTTILRLDSHVYRGRGLTELDAVTNLIKQFNKYPPIDYPDSYAKLVRDSRVMISSDLTLYEIQVTNLVDYPSKESVVVDGYQESNRYSNSTWDGTKDDRTTTLYTTRLLEVGDEFFNHLKTSVLKIISVESVDKKIYNHLGILQPTYKVICEVYSLSYLPSFDKIVFPE